MNRRDRSLLAPVDVDRGTPHLALLSRGLTVGDVRAVADELISQGTFEDIDIAAAIAKIITDRVPTPQDIERVRARLAAHGWPLGERDGDK